jgi:hypothetical protein
MKTRVWFGTATIGFIVILALGVGLVQANSEEVNTTTFKYRYWWYRFDIDTMGDVGKFASIAFDPGNGKPWISYYDVENTALKVAHYVGSGGNCGYVTWIDEDGHQQEEYRWMCETVDSSGDVGAYSSIDVYPNTGTPPLNNRKVGVAYYDATHGALKLTEYACLPLPCQWRTVTIEKGSTGLPYSLYGEYASMKYTEVGKSHIAYYHNSQMFNEQVRYAYPVTSGGNCGVGTAFGKWHCETVDEGDQVGKYASLDYSAYYSAWGMGGVAYYDVVQGDLKYAYYVGLAAGNCGTGFAWQCSTVDGTTSDVGKFVSVHVPTNSVDKLQFAYYDWSHGMLKYAVYLSGGGGNCGPGNSFQCDTIEAVGGGTDKAISLAVDGSNLPIIAYRKPVGLLPTQLNAAQPVGAPGVDDGNCGPAQSWKCATVDSGSTYDEEAEYASIDINPNRLAMIAYSELHTSEDPHVYSLKMAFHLPMVFLPVILR